MKLLGARADRDCSIGFMGVIQMSFPKGVALIAIFTASVAVAAPKKSTITFGKSEQLQSSPAKKRNFKQDIAAVEKAHEKWKKAHLDKVLYACQKNGEDTAILARKVADKMESSKADATKEAEAVQKALSKVLAEANDPAAALLTDSQAKELRAQLSKLQSAQKKGQILERLANQVKSYYLNDAPQSSPFGGGCPVSYSTARRRGVEASSQYQAEAQALLQKIESLTSRAKVALGRSVRVEMMAGR